MKRKALQDVGVDARKLVEVFLVIALHPISSLGLFNWK
jgi:hypothetical protein